MITNEEFQTQLLKIFQPLNNKAATHSFPPPGKLAESLREITSKTKADHWNVNEQVASYFATAAVEIWLRSVHSFLISTSLTEASPIWASVCGYYSSHYTVRGLAHLLGYFHLFKEGKTAQLQLGKHNRYVCSFIAKPGDRTGGEHKLYWILVKRNPIFVSDDLFTENSQDSDASDVAHRNFANYADHISRYPIFHPLDEDSLKARIERISKMVLNDVSKPNVPIPKRSKFPDVEDVQLIAYRRIISFRRILNEALGSGNKFWSTYRTPTFASGFMDFQLTEGSGLSQLNGR